jgi:hypothetical protein
MEYVYCFVYLVGDKRACGYYVGAAGSDILKLQTEGPLWDVAKSNHPEATVSQLTVELMVPAPFQGLEK